jgi:hypothetical protein
VLRISGGGDRIGDLTYVLAAPRRQIPAGVAFNGRELLVPWYDVTNQDFFGSWIASMPVSTMTPGPAQQIGRGIDVQTTLAAGAMNGRGADYAAPRSLRAASLARTSQAL